MREPRVLIIAHRGSSGIAPESTRAAIMAAARAGAQAIELDLQLSRDGRLVVFHDDRLERTTNGRGVLQDVPYARLARLDAGSWFHASFAGERILLASQAIRAIPRRMRINVELKRTRRPGLLVSRLLRLVRRAGISRRLLVSSFDPALLERLRSSGLARGLICRRRPEQALRQAIRLGCQSWHPFRALVTPRRLARAHAAGLRVFAWTVDDPAVARRLIRCGVDGFFTNHPERFQRLTA